ncbi:MAG: SgcJ/EcaC family oxidoreductase [Sphingomonas sp.]|nr:SgcJ/EcaC family oxidoreductase [Sphingomonas sp.]
MKRTYVLILAASAALLPACDKAGHRDTPETAQASTAADEQAIRDNIARWLQLIKANDSAAIAQLYADDGVVMAPNQPLVTGREAIAQYWQSMNAMPEATLTFQPERIEISSAGDMALDRGTYRFTAKPGGQTIDDTGKYLVVWKKVGADWKVAADMFNSDKPAAGG